MFKGKSSVVHLISKIKRLTWKNKISISENDISILDDLKSEFPDDSIVKIIHYSSDLKNYQTFDSKNAWNKVNKKTRSLNTKIWKIAGIAALFFIIAGYFTLIPNDKISYVAGISAKHLILQDGSEVILGQNSKLELSGKFNNSERMVSFEGNAYFNIAKNADKPFIINTNKCNIKVLGTEFYVNTISSQLTSVNLLHGKVFLSSDKEKVILNDGQKAKVNNGKIDLEIQSTPIDYSFDNDLIIDNESVNATISRLNSLYGKDVIILNPESKGLGNMTIHATIKNSSVNEFIKVLQILFQIEVIYSEGQFIISQQRK